MTIRTPTALLLILCLVSAGAQAQSTDRLAVAQMAASCAGCHGTEGRSAGGSPVPALAGAPKAQTLASLQAFRSGARPATIMQQLVRGYTEARLEQIAEFFAGQHR